MRNFFKFLFVVGVLVASFTVMSFDTDKPEKKEPIKIEVTTDLGAVVDINQVSSKAELDELLTIYAAKDGLKSLTVINADSGDYIYVGELANGNNIRIDTSIQLNESNCKECDPKTCTQECRSPSGLTYYAECMDRDCTS